MFSKLVALAMRILQLGKFYPIRGGIERVMYDIASGLSRRGIGCDMLCAEGESKGRVLRLNDYFRLIAAPTLATVASTKISPKMISSLREICGEYDIIDIHHPDPMANLALSMAGYKGKVILHWHSDILRQKLLLKLYRPFQDRLLRIADRIVVTSPVYASESEPVRKYSDKCVVIPIGVEPPQSDIIRVNALKERFSGRKIIFSLGRLVSYKGIGYLIEAARFLPREYVVVIGGDGPLRERLRTYISRLGLSDKVFLEGFIDEDTVGSYFSAASVFCLPSISKAEAFGIVQVEAMSVGLPVVATKIEGSGVPWVNSDGVSGININPCNAEEIADAILRITRDKDRYETYRVGAYNRYKELFTASSMIDRYASLYSMLI